MSNRPIGVLDSSVGGISVLRELRRIMPNECYVYLGDTANAPYGVRTEAEICDLTRTAAHMLLEKGIKVLLIACNTATSAAAALLREELAIPVIGMEPALKPAALARESGRIAVLATPATLRQRKFQALFAKYGEHAVALPCAGLMEFVERFELDSPRLHDFLREKLVPQDGGEPFTCIVLGCTHYVFLRPALQKIVPQARLFDGNRGTAMQVHAVLEAHNLLSASQDGSCELDTTGDSARILPVMQRLLTIEESGGISE